MDDHVMQLRTKAKRECGADLAEFIRYCRDDLTWTNDDPDFNWASPVWRGARWVKVTVGTRRVFDQTEQLDPEFVDSAKAYFRYRGSHSPGRRSFKEIPTLKVLEAALLAVTKSGSILELSLQVLDEAAAVARRHYGDVSRYEIGRHLRDIASFLSKRKLVPIDVSSWRSPFKRPISTRRTGSVGRQEIDRKMPSEAGIAAMAEIFANNPDDPMQRFLSAVWALLMSAPFRISEIFSLRVDAEVEEEDDDGNPCYGFRYYGAKGFEYDTKWVPTEMKQTARKAFRRIRDMTQSARALATHLESEPGVPFLYDDGPKVGMHDKLSLKDKAAYLRNPPPKCSIHRLQFWRFKAIAEHWEKARSDTPRGFPYFNKKIRLKWSEALFCMHVHALHPKHPTDYYRLWAPTTSTINDLMRLPNHRRGVGLLGQLGYTEPDGSPIKLTSHQPRHYLSTLAERGGMAQEDLAKWAGRANVKDNRVYNHMSNEEKVAQVRAVTQDIRLFGAHEMSKPQPPVTLRDFNLREAGPVHVTEFGYCTHPFVMSPCDKYRDCLNCTEHVYVKGNAGCYERIKKKVDFLQSQYDEAREAMDRKESGADRWLEYVSKTLFPAKELLAILESDEIENGAVIKRNPDAVREHSHLGRALEQRLPQPPDNSLAQNFLVLPNNGTNDDEAPYNP